MRAASTAGAFKALIESAGLGLAAYRDGAPATRNASGEPTVTAPYPHTVVIEGIGLEVLPTGDGANAAGVVVELVQVDLWQQARVLTAAGRATAGETYSLRDELRALFVGNALAPFAPWHVYGVRVADERRLPPDSAGLVRVIYTVAVTRASVAS